MTEWAIVDANLLLLLIVGRAGPELIEKHKRLRGDFSIVDYERVEELLAAFEGVVVVPQVLAEVSNFARHIGGSARAAVMDAFAVTIQGSDEQWVPSRTVVLGQEFRQYGLTDGALLVLCGASFKERTCSLITADQPRAYRAEALGYRAIDYRE